MQKLLVFKLKRPSDSLAAKLIIAIGGLMLAAGGAVGVMFYKYEESIAIRNLTGHARFATTLVLKTLRRNMLNARPGDIRITIDELSSTGDISELSIYSTEGMVAYSSSARTPAPPAVPDDNALRVMASGEQVLFLDDTVSGARALNLYVPIPAEAACLNAACHYHPRAADKLGVLRARISSEHIEGTSRQILVVTLGFGVILIATISGFLFVINFMLVTRPIATMERGIRRLAEGKFDEPIVIDSTDEMGRMARSFNTMAHDIQRYKNKLENWARELQEEVEKKAAEIQEAQDQLVGAEKLASLGRLAAGVAHEINNPLTGIVTFAHLMLERCPEDMTQDREDLEMIIEQADRCTKIVKGLLGFSRKGASEKMRCNINGLVEKAYSMVKSQSAFYDIQVAMKFPDAMPHIHADPNQIQQVILNLFTNASDAMNGVGRITIETTTVTEDGVDYVEMSFSDTGPGILPEHMDKILEPFFTTKATGKGTGLGLPVSYGIIKRHGGDLFVKSKPGRGTTFIVRLPVAVDDKGQEKADG